MTRRLAIGLAAVVLLATFAAAEDAEILSWEQTFTVQADGGLVRRDHRLVKINSSRAYGDFADPRIDYEEGRETVRILKAVTHLASGTILPVPDYSLNIASPNDVAGWPAWAAWRQRIVTFSGLEPGVVVELCYEVESAPGVHKWFEADLRIEERYPTRSRKVTVLVPKGTPLRHELSPGIAGVYTLSTEGAGTRHEWTFEDLPAAQDEPQSPPWRERCGRLVLCALGEDADPDRAVLQPIRRAAVAGREVRALAESATKDALSPREQAEMLVKAVRETLHVVGSRKTWRSLSIRPAEIVLREGYASPPEAAALLAALLTELGQGSVPVLLVAEDSGAFRLPVTDRIRDFLVMVDSEGEPLFVHPTAGPVFKTAEHRDLVIFDAPSGGASRVLDIPEPGRWGNWLSIDGKLAMDTEGGLRGRLKITASGRFFDPAALRTEDARKAFLGGISGRLVKGLEVTDYTVDRLGPIEFQATANVKLPKPWMKDGKTCLFRLGDGPMFPDRIPFPLHPADRRTDLRLAGAVGEEVNVRFEVPEGWKVDVPPGVRPAAEASSRVFEVMELVEGGFRLDRQIHLPDTVAATDFAEVRRAVSGMLADRQRIVAVRP